MDLLVIFVFYAIAIYVFYIVVKYAIKNGINESMLFSKEQKEAYKHKEDVYRRYRKKLTDQINESTKESNEKP